MPRKRLGRELLWKLARRSKNQPIPPRRPIPIRRRKRDGREAVHSVRGVKRRAEALQEGRHVLLAVAGVDARIFLEGAQDYGAPVEGLGPEVGEVRHVDRVGAGGEAGGG